MASAAAAPAPRPRPDLVDDEDDDEATRATRRPRVLLGVSGSVAAIKAPLVCERLLRFADVRVVLTAAARHFLPPIALPYGAPPPPPPPEGQEEQPPPAADDDGTFGFPAAAQPVLLDEHEWRDWRRVGDPVAHIELRRWADCLVVAPLSANTLSKMAHGGCDNLLTCVARAWDVSSPDPAERRPVLLAPAMNTAMWESPFTGEHLGVLARVLGARVVAPAVLKKLACGDVGAGAMAAPEEIAGAVARALAARGFAGEAVARAAAGGE